MAKASKTLIYVIAVFLMACWGSGFACAFTRYQGRKFGVMDAMEVEKGQKSIGWNPLKGLYWNGYLFYVRNYAEKSIPLKVLTDM